MTVTSQSVTSSLCYGTYLCAGFSLSTRHVVHMHQLITRVITRGTDQKTKP